MVLRSGAKRLNSHMTSTLLATSLSKRRLDCARLDSRRYTPSTALKGDRTTALWPLDRCRQIEFTEINSRESFSHYGFTRVPLGFSSCWHSSACNVVTCELDGHLGTKLRAPYQRNIGRDVSDPVANSHAT